MMSLTSDQKVTSNLPHLIKLSKIIDEIGKNWQIVKKIAIFDLQQDTTFWLTTFFV